MQLNEIITGTVGIGAVETIQHIPLDDNATQVIIQLIIAIITVIKLFWKPKKKKKVE